MKALWLSETAASSTAYSTRFSFVSPTDRPLENLNRFVRISFGSADWYSALLVVVLTLRDDS